MFLKKIKNKHLEKKYKILDQNIPINTTTTEQITYQTYQQVEQRIQFFNTHSIIGKDESHNYNLYLIELGQKEKPTIMVNACLHGTEWQSTQYSLSFMEQLRDNKFPDRAFRNYLLNHYHIIYIPVANPWGYAHTTPYARYKGRNNAKKVNLNRDFFDFTQSESKHIKNVIDKHQPFFYLDCHLMAPRKDGGQNFQDIIVGNVDHRSDLYRDFIAKALSKYADREVEQWNQSTNNEHRGLSRRYLFNKMNPYTSHTFSFISELYRPVKSNGEIVAYLSDDEIFKFGHASLYLFFKAAIHYYLTDQGKN